MAGVERVRPITTRRRFLIYGAGALLAGMAIFLGAKYSPLRPGGGVKWYEVVQDMKEPGQWHVNLYSGPALGDLDKGRLLRHQVVAASQIGEIRGGLEYPARIQFLDGRREADF